MAIRDSDIEGDVDDPPRVAHLRDHRKIDLRNSFREVVVSQILSAGNDETLFLEALQVCSEVVSQAGVSEGVALLSGRADHQAEGAVQHRPGALGRGLPRVRHGAVLGRFCTSMAPPLSRV